MVNGLEYRVVLGSLRYKSASNTNLLFQIPLVQTAKENVEFDRTLTIQLEELYDKERQKCTIFRPTAKLSLLFSNIYSGFTDYYPYESSLYYTNIEGLIAGSCDTSSIPYFSGYPQYYEFDFIRNDNNISGYTILDSGSNYHQKFVTKSASSYNWVSYLSYAYDNDFNKQMQVYDSVSGQFINWTASDGIPFVLYRSNTQGETLISFRCQMPHGLSVGDYVELQGIGSNLTYNNENVYQVYSLGDPFYGTENNIFNIYDIGYTGTTFTNNNIGTFKRIADIANSAETKSRYYVRKHKILTEAENAEINKSGFEQLIFKKETKLENSGYTPNSQTRISVKESNSVYTLTYNKDIDINPILDNQKRPISELFYTIIWKGYMGWTMGTKDSFGNYYGLKQGWTFNVPPFNTITNTPTPWWSNSNSNSNVGIPLGTYSTALSIPNFDFTYVLPLNIGDVIDGDYCEWNDYEQNERVISDLYHKFKFNPYYFKISPLSATDTNPKGYYYKPHYSISIRAFSDYLEEAPPQGVVGIPSYSFFSTLDNKFIWRDLYPYGYIDTEGIGVNFPFLNNAHYPYREIFFRLIGEGADYNEINASVVSDPTIDDCE